MPPRIDRSNPDEFNKPTDESEKLRSVQAKADEVANIARQNIQLSIAQVDRLSEMEERAAQLEESSGDFHKGARAVRSKMWWRSCKMLICIAITIIILILVIVVPIVIEEQKRRN